MEAEMELEAYSNLTPVQSFFYGKSIFLTGVTGLVGKVLLEKLLRCCPGIKKIYLLIRSKKNLSSHERLEKIFKTELFSKVKEVYPQFRNSICIVEGDITKDRLGLTIEDFEKVQANVQIVMHSAASVQFNDPLKIAVEHNLIATKTVMKFCHELPRIEVLVHLSTAYVKREKDGSVLESVPKYKISPKQLLDALEWMDDKCENAVSDFLLDGELTTYLVTKAFAEMVIQEEHGNIPVAIVRPCYVGPTAQDPFPGWVDSIQGISGLLLAGAKGVLRTLKSVDDLKLNIIPLDYVINSVIVGAWYVGTERPADVYVANCVMDYDKLPLANNDILSVVLKKRDEYPLVNMFRYPHFTIYYNEIAFQLHALIDQWIPAMIVDAILFIFTGQTILVKIYKKINFLYGIFYRIAKNKWICRLENYNAMKKRLSEKDSEIFFLDTDSFDWQQYIDNCLQGGRKFLAREDPSNIPYAKKKAKCWWIVTTLLKYCFILFAFYYILSCFGILSNAEERMYTIHN
ncbi:fatty acyl-CoA reductase 1-like [Uloborus diversus]|uniref:fatty acyl-CoA reductase 1-like n=1 Tax=Uloborus diversus TaxID=327109 RepID=UPI0024094BC0|nr:fatty acyl-CoA reductase 1-like [Uloborus diversus]XP_054709744.1 fatty acyl-CoA reductase 1-like [Uloborus diversus]XP_054709745.1 fatty acyl-CoA reductase 1-like [Uloborus diversus]XP_054709746.1 fatty acyl-CoA reductase 1-like [Uloborus diversus]